MSPLVSRADRPLRRRRPVSSKSPDETSTGEIGSRTAILDAKSVIGLQRTAGNSATAGLLQQVGPHSDPGHDRPAVQRNELDPADDREGYTKPGGKKITGTGTTRIEVTGLKFGLDDDSQVGNESQMTKERPAHTAVVIMPDTVDARTATQVILHFHGWGFRSGDPYPGYAVSTGKPGARQGPKHSVRDVDQEHWEQQIGAIAKDRAKNPQDPNSTGGPQVVAILAQGRGKSEFGKVPTFDYVQDVLSKVPALKPITQYSIVLTAHSGGGDKQVASKVNSGDIVGKDRSKIPAPVAGKAAQQPSDLVVLFDAEGAASTIGWVTGEINKLAKEVKDPAGAQAAIDAAPKFRGYFATRGSYWDNFHSAAENLEVALKAIPAAWRDPDPANPGATRVRDLFRIIEVAGTGVDHEHVISGGTTGPAEAGSVADALRASLNPTIDRAKAYDPVSGGKRLKKFQEEVAARRAKEKAAKEKAEQEKAAKQVQPAPVQPLSVQSSAARTVNADPGSSGSTGNDHQVVQRAWKKKDVSSQYALTADDTTLLAGKTPDQRAADRSTLNMKRYNTLTRAEKKNKLKAGEDKELADLRILKDRVEITQRALGRKDVEEVIADAGQGTVAQWFGDVQQGTFLGISLQAHKSLAARLTRAESALVADPAVNPGKVDATALGGLLKMYASTSDLRQPAKAVGGNSLSMHTFGLAVDLNYLGNPFIGNKGALAPNVIRRATSLVTGTPVSVTTALGDAKASFTSLKAASDAMKTYFSYRDAANLPALTTQVQGHPAAKGEPTDVSGWLKQINADHANLSADGTDFEKHKPPEEGFLDLDEAVVLALANAGLTWGGTYGSANGGAKDIMHFDLRQAEGAKIDAARTAHTSNR